MNTSEFLDRVRIGAQLAVGEQPKCPPGYCAGLATCGNYNCPGHPGASEDTPIATPEEAQGWTAAAGYYLIAALAFIAFLLVTVMVAASTKSF